MVRIYSAANKSYTLKKLLLIWLPSLVLLLGLSLLRNNWFIQLNTLLAQGYSYDYITNSQAPQWMLTWSYTSLSTLRWLLLAGFIAIFYVVTSVLLGFGWTHNYRYAFKITALVYAGLLALAVITQGLDVLLPQQNMYAFTRSLLGIVQSPFVFIGVLIYKEGLMRFVSSS